MSTTVSQSPKPDEHELTRQQRDDSFSTGGGRKDTEKPKAERPKADSCKDDKECSLKPPIGLDSETKGDADITEDKKFESER